MLTYARQYWRQRTVRHRLRNFCINKNSGNLISREDRIQSRFAETRLAETPTLTLNPNT